MSLFGALAGCATPPPAAPGVAVVTGRLSLAVAASGGQPARQVSAGFELAGDAERGTLALTSPLGTLLARADWSAAGATLQTPDGSSRHADLDALAAEALGEPVPLRALPSWLGGRPWPASPHLVTADGFEQLGWRVGLARFGEGFVEATRAAPPAVTLRVRLERAP